LIPFVPKAQTIGEDTREDSKKQ